MIRKIEGLTIEIEGRSDIVTEVRTIKGIQYIIVEYSDACHRLEVPTQLEGLFNVIECSDCKVILRELVIDLVEEVNIFRVKEWGKANGYKIVLGNGWFDGYFE